MSDKYLVEARKLLALRALLPAVATDEWLAAILRDCAAQRDAELAALRAVAEAAEAGLSLLRAKHQTVVPPADYVLILEMAVKETRAAVEAWERTGESESEGSKP